MQDLTRDFLPLFTSTAALSLQNHIGFRRDLSAEIFEFDHTAPRMQPRGVVVVPISIEPKCPIFNTKMVLPMKKERPQNNKMTTGRTFYTDFCRRLRRIRERQEWSQQQMAALIGIPMANYQKYEQGKRRMPLDVVARVARVTGESLDVLLTGSLPETKARISGAAWAALKRGQREALIREGYMPETPSDH